MSKERKRLNKIARQKATASKDITKLFNDIEINEERKESCRYDLKLFCETYLPDVFFMGWSKAHDRAIQKIEDSILNGGLFAFAMPRGSGKTTLSRASALWATLYRHRRYVFCIGANAGKGQDAIDTVKVWLRFSPTIAQDFPYVSIPFQALEGIAQRAGGQVCYGMPTNIKFEKDRLVMPYIEVEGEPVETSGTILASSGLTGDGIRGSVFATTTGELIRPDFVILDDPQTDESAHSVSQNKTRESLISGAILGMAGAGKTISGVMPCTVIAPNDMVDRLLDKDKHPSWRGERWSMLETMPADLDAWEKYFDVYRECLKVEPADYETANKYYEDNREKLDKGASASWDDRKIDHEVSAIQHAMNLYFRDEFAFWSEYQNKPMARDDSGSVVSWQEVVKQVNGYERLQIPQQVSTLTAMIDVQGDLLWWVLMGFDDNATGYILDYGAFPDQMQDYFTNSKARNTLSKNYPMTTDLESKLFAGLKDCCDFLIQERPRDDGVFLTPKRILIDSAWGMSTKTVYSFCRQYRRQEVMSYRGFYIGASSKSFLEYKRISGEINAEHWRRTRVKDQPIFRLDSDVNFWKSEFTRRIKLAHNAKGGITLFKGSERRHRMFAEQVTAERAVRVKSSYKVVDEWKLLENSRDNHLFDCICGCICAAEAEGIRPHRPSDNFNQRKQTRRRRGAGVKNI